MFQGRAEESRIAFGGVKYLPDTTDFGVTCWRVNLAILRLPLPFRLDFGRTMMNVERSRRDVMM